MYGFVNQKTGESIFSILLPYLESMLDASDIIISRCKHLNATGQSYEDLSKAEANVCNNLSRIVITALQLTQTRYKAFDPLIKLLMKIFTSVDNLAKHFLIRIKKVKTVLDAAKFDILVNKHLGKELTPRVFDLITFINDANTSSAVISKGSKSKKSMDGNLLKARVLRDTKRIPDLVKKIEDFLNNLQKLDKSLPGSKKLMEGIKLATSRDFRLKLDNINGTSNENNAEENMEQDEAEISSENVQAESTRIDSSILSNSQMSNILSSQEDPDASGLPPSKKLKVKMSFSKKH